MSPRATRAALALAALAALAAVAPVAAAASVAGVPHETSGIFGCDEYPPLRCHVAFDTCHLPAVADPYHVLRRDVWIGVPGPIFNEPC